MSTQASEEIIESLEFPHPNPNFPDLPRPGMAWQLPAFLTCLGLVVASVLGLAFGYKALEQAHLQTVSLVLMGVAAVGTLIGFISLDGTLKARGWRTGRIIPAMVIEKVWQGGRGVGELLAARKEIFNSVVNEALGKTANVVYFLDGRPQVAKDVRISDGNALRPATVIWFIPPSLLTVPTVLGLKDSRVMHCPQLDKPATNWLMLRIQ